MAKEARRQQKQKITIKVELSNAAIESLNALLDACQPQRLSNNLRRVLLDYITAYKDALPLDFGLYLNDFNALFEFLEVLEDEHKE